MGLFHPFFHTCNAQIVVKNLLNAKSESVKIVSFPTAHTNKQTRAHATLKNQKIIARRQQHERTTVVAVCTHK